MINRLFCDIFSFNFLYEAVKYHINVPVAQILKVYKIIKHYRIEDIDQANKIQTCYYTTMAIRKTMLF